jgi:hypothetical protein
MREEGSVLIISYGLFSNAVLGKANRRQQQEEDDDGDGGAEEGLEPVRVREWVWEVKGKGVGVGAKRMEVAVGSWGGGLG